jgi:hypothetical protein
LASEQVTPLPQQLRHLRTLIGRKSLEERRMGQSAVRYMQGGQVAECRRGLRDSVRIVIFHRFENRFARGFQIGVNLSGRTGGARDNDCGLLSLRGGQG